MSVNETQSSNNTGLSLAKELSFGKVDGAAVWYQQEPNSYKSFGATYKLVQRKPISSDRQYKKGVITDLDASGGWQEDMTFEAMLHKCDGLMYADFRLKASTAATGAVAADHAYLVSSNAGFAVGDLVFSSGMVRNKGAATVTDISTAGELIVSEVLADESGATGTIMRVGHQAAVGDISFDAATKTLASVALDFTTLGLIAGEWLYLSADDAAHNLGANIGFCRVGSVAAHAIVLDKIAVTDPTNDDPANVYATATGAGKSVRFYFGRVIKNEKSALIKRYTYQAERTLGKADTTSTYEQAEYLGGGVLDEAVFTFNSADKVTVEWGMTAGRKETRTSDEGPKAGTRASAAESSAFNTSTDIRRMSIEICGQDAPLYGYVMDASLTVKNNNKPNKALGILGAFAMNEGAFVVSGSVTAYFSTVEAGLAIENNADVTVDVILARDNHGIVFDVPLISLGDGAPKVTANEVIQLPLSIDAATAVSINPNTDYTFMMVFFDYLPNIATV